MGILPSDFYNNTINIKQENTPPLLKDYLIDLKTGAVKFDKNGCATIVTGINAIITQIWRILHTQKGGYIIFSDRYGSRIHELLGYGKDVADTYVQDYLNECLVRNYTVNGHKYINKIINYKAYCEETKYIVNFDMDTIYGQASYLIDDMIFEDY